MKRSIATLVLLAVAGLALVLTSQGGPATGDADTAGPAVPEIAVARLDGGEAFELGRLAAAERPTLLWFWAPWCEVCNHEAPAVERLAADAGDDLAVVAIGGRDKIANGPEFVARHRLRTPTLLFDEPMTAWSAYGIPGQPAGVLLDRSGHERRRWLGAFDTAEVLEAARSL